MVELFQKIRHRANVEIKKAFRWPLRQFLNPFNEDEKRPVIIHCCYHKIGTVWFARILKEVAAEFGLSFDQGTDYQKIHKFETSAHTDIFLDQISSVKLNQLPYYRGSHIIRDPRDMIISGYFYHLWAKETWANIPMVEYRGMTYKEYLNSLNQDQGVSKEIKSIGTWIHHMMSWDYNNPSVLEIKYENIIVNEEPVFEAMFTHFGFKKSAVDRCCQIADKYSFKNMTKGRKAKAKSGKHLRSGKIGEWRELFNENHKNLFKKLYPGTIVALGYEKDDNW